MRIAVASQNFRTVTAHAGRTRRFLVYEVAPDTEPVEVERLDLPKEMSMHDFAGDGPHPLDAVDALIAGSCGPGFARRMAARGVRVFTTAETDPMAAIRSLLASGEDTPSITCSGHHHHEHGHHHQHDHHHAHGRRHRPPETAEPAG